MNIPQMIFYQNSNINSSFDLNDLKNEENKLKLENNLKKIK